MFVFPDGLTPADAFKIWAYDFVVMFFCDFTKLIYKYMFEHASAGVIDESQDFTEEGDDMVDEDEHANRPTEMGKVDNQVMKTRDVVNRMSVMGTAEEPSSRISTVQRVSEFITEGKVRPQAPASTGVHYISQAVNDHQIRASMSRGRSASRAYNA
jgi:hypothetical protein